MPGYSVTERLPKRTSWVTGTGKASVALLVVASRAPRTLREDDGPNDRPAPSPRPSAGAEGTSVEVVGTVRRFDLAEAERVFDIDLDDAIYEPSARSW